MRFSFFVVTLLSFPLMASEDPCLTPYPHLPSSVGPSTGATNSRDLTSRLSLSLEERTSVLCSIRQHFRVQYSAGYAKKELSGFDVDQQMLKCIRDELPIADGNRLLFTERTIRCVAHFKDSHLLARRAFQAPNVTTAIRSGWFGGHLYVVSVDKPMLSRAAEVNRIQLTPDSVSVGDEIVAVDGKPARQAMEEMRVYEGQSSDKLADMMAGVSVLGRNYHYPKRNWIEVRIKNKEGREIELKLPWTATGGRSVPEANEILEKANIQFVPKIYERWDEKDGWKELNWRDPNEFSTHHPLVGPITNYFSKPVSPDSKSSEIIESYILATAEVLKSRREAFCYIQLNSFMFVEVYDANAQKKSLMDVLAQFVSGCETKQLPLIFDVRNNHGGRADLPSRVFSLLAESNKKYRGPFLSIYTSKANVSALLEEERDALKFTDLDKEAEIESIRDGLPFSRPLFYAQINSTGPGYNQPIVVLIAPTCISGCDLFAGLFKSTKRATLIGEPTAGTGAGMWTGAAVDPEFRDYLNLFRFKIPNFLFGIIPEDVSTESLTWRDSIRYSMENRPVEPDIEYIMTAEDIRTHGKPLLKKAVEILMSLPQPTQTPAAGSDSLSWP